MSPETEHAGFATIEIPQVRRGPWGYLKIGAALLAIGGAIWAWQAGYRPPVLGGMSRSILEFVEIDRGDIELDVVETGSVESSANTTVRCTVEAILGVVGGAQGATGAGKTAGGAGGGGGQGGSTGGAQGGGATGGQADQGAAATKGKAKTAKKAGSSSSGGAGATGAAGSSPSGGGGGGGTSGASGGSGSMGGGSGGASGSTSAPAGGSSGGAVGTTAAGSKPVIRSFTYVVTPHVPLRPAAPKPAPEATKKKTGPMPGGGRMGGGMGGGRGPGRGGRGGMGGMMEEEKPGSTTIVEIAPEGTKVKAGEVVCRLDASTFEDEEKSQLIRYLQAKSYVDQAQSILEVNEITLREYREGIYPQDLMLCRQYVTTCKMELDRLTHNAEWSVAMQKKGYRTYYQSRGDLLAVEQAKIALGEADNMVNRLTKQTGPKILKALEANVRAIQADKYLQDAAFNLEAQRLARIRKNIERCTLTAPRDGIVVYATQTDRGGRVITQIDQGVTVRQDQPIFNLPDPLHMRVKARVNESKFALIHTGQAVRIVVDAYPDRPLRGRVAEIAAINLPLNQSDVRIYFANVDIIDEFEDLRPGLSAECVFEVDSRHDVVRVPLESIRWLHGQAYVAVHDRARQEAGEQPWVWKKIALGVSDSRYAEVVTGIEAGDRIAAAPHALPAPVPAAAKPAATNLAILTP
jgi:multidrug resistance efflux pump